MVMKAEFLGGTADALARQNAHLGVASETDRLTEVLLCRPTYLEAVPCCSVTRSSLDDGFTPSLFDATRQHIELEAVLEANGVACRLLPAQPGMPDLCFTRDSAVMTPWGLLGLNPAAAHRRMETAQMLVFARNARMPTLGAIEIGTVEGGDVCVLRDGLLVVGWSGERTDARGAEAVCELFRAAGWRTMTYRFDPHFLHLDTQFCMVDDGLALACVDVLHNDFLRQIAAEGIELIPVTYKEAQRLGCNLLALGGRRVIASAGNARVAGELRRHGVQVDLVDVSQFERCGGGIHCLTMPLVRESQAVAR
jgi:N-dimethylarginine dimethylaminohydrolase